MLNRKRGQRGTNIERAELRCSNCESTKTWNNKWLRIESGIVCYKCYQRSSYNYRKSHKAGKRKKSPCETKYYYRFNTGVIIAHRTRRLWDISLDIWQRIIEDGCYYCGTQLTDIPGYSLDRIDNNKHYTLENVIPCCGFCNGIKSNRLTLEETKIAVEAILNWRKHAKENIACHLGRSIGL